MSIQDESDELAAFALSVDMDDEDRRLALKISALLHGDLVRHAEAFRPRLKDVEATESLAVAFLLKVIELERQHRDQ